MSPNEVTIDRFYSAFQKLDYATMQSCYHPDAVFNDPVFGLLHADETLAMWEMLCKRAKDFSLLYGDIKLLDEEYTTCRWTASYLFSKTGRRIVNKVTAHMKFKDGLIIEHTDAFDIYRWCRQAFGITGLLLGWTSFMHRRIQKQAKEGLVAFMDT
ncbi:MAG: nuclear transport factor 2 family protein [Sediminibacterium sp.]|nr:nuclear transport factor 2 family protein [Sediminibacterium sp.]